MSRAGLRRVRNGEVALICVCARLGAADWEGDGFAGLIERADRLADVVPQSEGLMTGVALFEMVKAYVDFTGVLRATRRRPSAERDWTDASMAQAQLRKAVRACEERLGDRCYAIWAGEGVVPDSGFPARGDDIQDGNLIEAAV